MAKQTKRAPAKGARAKQAPAKRASAGAQPYYTMIFDQSAHLDWDWIRNFPQNFWYAGGNQDYYPPKPQGVQQILTQAIANLQQFNTDGSNPYYYAICEMGFLKQYVEENPQQITAIKSAGENFQVIGGGMTSPDCLVCSGEGFVRNYLVGNLWLSQALPTVPPRPHCWIPDDFGQGPELPVLLQALGFVSVGFSRLPGTLGTCSRTNPQQELLNNGVDFSWQASDGSQAIAHWMPVSYAFGDDLNNGPEAINQFTAAYQPNTAQPPQYSAAATPYMYIPIDNDFSMPVQGLLDDVDQWNSNAVQQGAQASNVQVAAATFDTFVNDIAPLQGSLQQLAPYNGTPYWTGYYASRPELKILHYAAVRALVAAEIFGLLTQPGNSALNNMLPTTFWSDLAETWMDFAPSTHHDYICGTALDSIYATEQLPLLQAVAARAGGLRAAALNALAGMTPSNGYSGQCTILVANSLGFQSAGLTEIANVVLPGVQSVSFDGTDFTPVQRSAEGGMLFKASVPSFGYSSGNISTSPPSIQESSLSISPLTSGANSYVLKNDILTVTISESANWGIASLVDNASGVDILRTDVPANDIVFYQDGGDIYQFGNEYVDEYQTTFQVDQNVGFATSGAGLGALVLETGPLRVRLRTIVLATVSTGESGYFIREYALVAGEPFLRMSTTGAAPLGSQQTSPRFGYSVMVRFPFASQVTSITHGTAYHWTDVPPLAGFWGPPTFQATHDFLIPQDTNGTTLAAVYHGAIPAWAFDAGGALIGCLLRNTPNGPHGASGTDPAPHTQHYALRLPAGLSAASSGQPLQEALAYNTPLHAVEVPPGNSTYAFPGMMTQNTWSLASAAAPAILTVAKPGSFDDTSLILRMYQPTNGSATVAVTLANGEPTSATVVTAVEGAWAGPSMPIDLTANGFSLTMNAAVATVGVAGAGLPTARASRGSRRDQGSGRRAK